MQSQNQNQSSAYATPTTPNTADADYTPLAAAHDDEIPDVQKEKQQQQEQQMVVGQVVNLPVAPTTTQSQQQAPKKEKWYDRLGREASNVVESIGRGMDSTHRVVSESFGTSPASCAQPPSQQPMNCFVHGKPQQAQVPYAHLTTTTTTPPPATPPAPAQQ